MNDCHMYAGEALHIFLKGTKCFDIKNIDFSVYVYPDGCSIEGAHRKDKSDCVLLKDEEYECVFGPEITATFCYCSYTIEIRDKTNEMIIVKEQAFFVKASASAKDIKANG